jgi:ribosome-binding factor A
VKNKIEQVSQSLKKALGQVLLKEFPHQTELAIADVLVDPNFKSARVWLRATRELMIQINKHRGKIQSELGKYIEGRYTPKLTFLVDDNYLEHLDELFYKLG